MRSYIIKISSCMALLLLAALLGCSGAEPGPAPERPVAEAVTPAADLSAGAALEAAAGAEGARGEEGADHFPGRADVLPGIKAVSEFCARPGSLAFMTRDGCKKALPRLMQSVTGNTYFASLDECLAFLRDTKARRNEIVEEHKAWCDQTFVNLHDRKGCYDAAPIFLGSLTEQGFCRKAPPPVKQPERPRDIEAPYISNYSEPGQKFDSPKTGAMPGKTAVKKSAPAPKTAEAPKTAPPAKALSSAPAPQAAQPAEAPSGTLPEPAPLAPPAIDSSALPALAQPAPASAAPPSSPEPPALGGNITPSSPVLPAPAQSAPVQPQSARAYQPVERQSITATIGPNAVSPAAVPAGVLATSGGQVEADSVLPPAEPRSSVLPVLPATELLADDLPEPVIGTRENIEALPPVPPLGRIAPPLMPGVPPDTAVTDNTLPAPEVVAPPAPPATGASAPLTDAFGDIIPNFMPPPPPDPFAGQAGLPVGGSPAGQSQP